VTGALVNFAAVKPFISVIRAPESS
jgi:hypothetical protein